MGPIRLASTKVMRRLPTQPHPGHELPEAIKLMKAFAIGSYDERVELVINTSLDPRKPNQMLRGVSTLPHGSGKDVKIAVFAKGEKAEEAKAAGADYVGGQELVDMIQDGNIDFDRCIASPDMMGFCGRVARILGPRGLMPSPKTGSVTNDIATTVANAKQGEIQYKCDKMGVLILPVGRVSFDNEGLQDNIEAFVQTVLESKPSGAKKVGYIVGSYLSSSRGKGIRLDISKPPYAKRK